MNRRTLKLVTALSIAVSLLSCVNTGKKTATSTAPEVLPERIGSTGWIRHPEISRFVGDSLFEYIDGAAEMYHKYDFVELTAAEYHKGEGTITADVYRFTNSDRAFGMYTTLRPDMPDTIMLGVEGFTFGANWVYVKGPYIANVYAYEDSEEMISAVRSIAARIEARLLGTAEKPPTFDLFPEERRVAFSEKIYAESFLGQGFLTDVYTIDYERDGSRFTLFLSEDPASAKLEAWRESAVEAHDPDAGHQHLPYDGSRYLYTRDSYHGEIMAGPRGDRLVGMVGYDRQYGGILLSWLAALIEVDEQ
jgi:hypothetical protein